MRSSNTLISCNRKCVTLLFEGIGLSSFCCRPSFPSFLKGIAHLEDVIPSHTKSHYDNNTDNVYGPIGFHDPSASGTLNNCFVYSMVLSPN